MIRKSTPADAHGVVPLIDIVFEEMEIPQLMVLSKSVTYPVFEKAFLLPDYRYGYPNTYVAEEDGKIKGILVGYPHEKEAHIDDAFAPLLPELGMDPNERFFTDQESYPGEWYLDTFAVAEDSQGQGIGTKLIETVLPELAASGVERVSLNVDQANPRAQKLYERLGFEKTGELMIGTHRYNHMVKLLAKN
ncbi:GNAT family N-acetyltransferase [Lacticaseibacillus brantae]|uniref:GNAT family acetyltransferase protein n=1 Tax=Lacticaseibacillus brantae DSM 23927 TaxID=1423727 RepID=A0A0R2B7S5_9LACO|nr:GNAT family N-acetyltransferase [Lacticaseibacillus brantae]KRM72393.1 GNAT family acetyltransferase protein [Lacticaseibacillus brantae DSM 23927]